MNRPLDITARQVTALCKGAAKAGCVPVVQIGNTLVRLLPEDRAVVHAPANTVDEEVEIDL